MPIVQGNCRHLVRFPRFKNNILEIKEFFEKITTKVTHNELKSFLKDQFILDTNKSYESLFI